MAKAGFVNSWAPAHLVDCRGVPGSCDELVNLFRRVVAHAGGSRLAEVALTEDLLPGLGACVPAGRPVDEPQVDITRAQAAQACGDRCGWVVRRRLGGAWL